MVMRNFMEVFGGLTPTQALAHCADQNCKSDHKETIVDPIENVITDNNTTTNIIDDDDDNAVISFKSFVTCRRYYSFVVFFEKNDFHG